MASDPCDGRILEPDALPLDYFLAVMRDPTVSDRRRERVATLAAPYCHEKVAYRALTKGDQKKMQARKAAKETEWAGLIKTGTQAARTGKKDSLQDAA